METSVPPWSEEGNGREAECSTKAVSGALVGKLELLALRAAVRDAPCAERCRELAQCMEVKIPPNHGT
jgi:hypothetical protein